MNAMDDFGQILSVFILDIGGIDIFQFEPIVVGLRICPFGLSFVLLNVFLHTLDGVHLKLNISNNLKGEVQKDRNLENAG